MGRRLPDTAFFAAANGARLRPHAVSRQRLCVKSGNVFAGIPAGTFGDFDLQGIIERRVFVLGTSGSDVSDMRTVLRKIEDGVIDTVVSLDAITGMAGFADAIGSVIDRTSGGKVMVFPSLYGLGLIRLSELETRLPHVAAKLKNGRWTKEPEEALLAGE